MKHGNRHSTTILTLLQMAFFVLTATATTPTNISIPQVGGQSVRVAWQNNASTTKNIVYLHKLVQIPESGTTIETLNFDEFSNLTLRTVNYTEEIVRSYPSLQGSYMLYLPTNSVGQIMISKSDESGVVVHSAFDDYSNLWLELLTRRYNYDKELKSMNIGYIDTDGSTNNFASITLENELQRKIVPLADVPSGRRLVLNKANRKNNNRVIVDELKFIRDYEAAHVETNLVCFMSVANTESAKLKHLNRETEYLVSVSAIDSSGAESEPSPPIAFTTTSELEIGFSVRLR